MKFIPEEIITQVLERTDIVQTISTYVALKKAGRNFKANCPFHQEKTPSFVVNPDKQIFHCFGCGVGGNVISFLMHQERMDFPETVQMLAQKVGIVIPETLSGNQPQNNLKEGLFQINQLAADFFHQELLTGRDPTALQARQYLKNRGLSLEVVKKFQIGFAPALWDGLINFLRARQISMHLIEKAGLIIARENKDGYYDRFRNRIIFPIIDIRQRCVAFGARSLVDDQVKYINTPETPVYVKGQHLYGLHLAKESVAKQNAVVVVEGYMDFVMPFQLGCENMVASLGTALTVEQIRLIRRYTSNVVMLFDADKAGQSAIARSLDLLLAEGLSVSVAQLEAGDDPDSYVRKKGIEAFKNQINNSISFFDFQCHQLSSMHDRQSIEGKAKIAQGMFLSIAKFENEVIRFGYIKKLATYLDIQEQLLINEFEKSIQQPVAQGNVKPMYTMIDQSSENADRHIKAEFLVLSLLLVRNDLIVEKRESLNHLNFQEKDAQQILARILELADQGKEVTVTNLMSSFSDQFVLQKIASLIVAEETFVVDAAKMLEDCLAKLKSQQKKQQQMTLIRQIEQAESQGNHAQVDILKKRYHQLIKGSI